MRVIFTLHCQSLSSDRDLPVEPQFPSQQQPQPQQRCAAALCCLCATGGHRIDAVGRVNGRLSCGTDSLRTILPQAATRACAAVSARHCTIGSFKCDRPLAIACTAQHSTAQHSTAQHSTAQHSTAQHIATLRAVLCTPISASPSTALRMHACTHACRPAVTHLELELCTSLCKHLPQ
jgi:hypothetical protein